MLDVDEKILVVTDAMPPQNRAGSPARRNVKEKVRLVSLPKPPSVPSEQTLLMLKVRDHRDRAAFGALFDHFAPKVKGVIMRSGVSGAAADDIVQDVMLTLWQKAHQFDPARAQVSSWVYQIARNRHIDVIRRERRPVPEALKHEETVEEDASEIVALEEETTKLITALGTLTEDQREMVEKAYLGELSHNEIQVQTGLPLGTIKSRIRLGLERLRHELKGSQ